MKSEKMKEAKKDAFLHYFKIAKNLDFSIRYKIYLSLFRLYFSAKHVEFILLDFLFLGRPKIPPKKKRKKMHYFIHCKVHTGLELQIVALFGSPWIRMLS